MGMKKYTYVSMGLFLLTLVCILSVHTPVFAATFTVTNKNNSGPGSLRQAITDANNTVATDTISFNIGAGGWAHILPTSALPAIYHPVTLDATTQPGFIGKPLVEISGNQTPQGSIGLYLTGDASGSTVRGLVINGFGGQGIFIDTNNIAVKGNYIGTNTDGTWGVGNGGGGIGIFSGTSAATANNNVIGGTTAADRNIISGNGENGIVINAQNGGHTQNNVISGNYVGTNAAGTEAIQNWADGILINDAGNGTASGNTIGGTTGVTPGGGCTGACNLVSGNGYNGIGVWHAGAPSNTIAGNYVGVNVAGSWVIRNANIGVELNESANNVVGGTDSASRNILSGNAGAGVFITGDASTGNRVTGNYIGVDSTGSYSLNNLIVGVGIGYSPGIQPAHHNIVGSSVNKTPGLCDGGCNVISGNAADGIMLSSSQGNTIAANHIGVNKDNSAFVGNTTDGIGLIDSGNTMIGGDNPEDGNVINGNGDNGIVLTGNSSGTRIVSNLLVANRGNGVLAAQGVNIAILQNEMYANGKLGIDLGQNRITRNDWNDGDGGVNNQQNFPEIYAVKSKNGSSYVSGTLNSQPNTSYRLDFYQSSGCNAGKPDNFGEGELFVGSTVLTTDQFGNKVYTFRPADVLDGNTYITATATKMLGSIPAETSEFSLCRLVNTSRPITTNGATWNLKDDLTSGSIDKSFGYGFPSYLLMCAWDANQLGVKLPVVYSNGTWFMRASYTTGKADNQFYFDGGSSQGSVPICGDWDGDGVDTVGVVLASRYFQFRNSNTAGPSDMSTEFGVNDYPLVIPVTGDWDGNGTTDIGIVAVRGGLDWRLRTSISSGPGLDPTRSDMSFTWGGNSGRPVTGDWDGDGSTDIGIYYENSNGRWDMRTDLSDGPTNGSFSFGGSGYKALTW